MNTGIKVTFTAAMIVGALALTGCIHHPKGRHARAELSPTAGNNVRGAVDFYETPKGVHVKGKFSGLTPGKHGFHIHEKGDCSAPDAASAGPHFNPTKAKHGGPHDADRHAGDFGNIIADASGNATFDWVDKHITFDGTNSIIGRGVIVHADEDDLKTQQSPTTTPGNAGPRVCCGVIKMH